MRAAGGRTVWIGAVRHGRGNGPGAGHWHWSNGEPWTYTRWCQGEPNNYAGQENRVQMYGRREFRPPWGMHANDGEWNDINARRDTTLDAIQRRRRPWTPYQRIRDVWYWACSVLEGEVGSEREGERGVGNQGCPPSQPPRCHKCGHAWAKRETSRRTIVRCVTGFVGTVRRNVSLAKVS